MRDSAEYPMFIQLQVDFSMACCMAPVHRDLPFWSFELLHVIFLQEKKNCIHRSYCQKEECLLRSFIPHVLLNRGKNMQAV